MRQKILVLSVSLFLSSCLAASDHHARLHSSNERAVTVGTVQKTIHRGMSAAEVAESLGSPNIVTRDELGGETWIYDKIATEASYSRDSGTVTGGAAGGAGGAEALIIGLLGGNYQRSAGAQASTQRTLTVIIKFDESARVSSFSYHASKF